MKKAISLIVLFTLFAFAYLVGQPTAWAEEKPLEIKPYGFILFNAQYNDKVRADIPVKAALTDTMSNFLMTARQTRFGLKMNYEADWKIAGQIELDFFGLRGSGANGASMQSAPRLRLANFKITKEDATFLFGQDWTIFAPLNPTSWAHVSIPHFSSSGNLWNRFPQIKGEYKAKIDENNSLLLQGALLRPLGADVDPVETGKGVSQTDQLGAGEVNVLPFVQARAAISIGKTATIGASAHFGQEDFSKARNDTTNLTDDKTTSMAVAGDVKAKADIVSFGAEGYWGKNLPMLFSNAYVKSSKSGNKWKIEGIETMGGWGEVSIAPQNTKVTFNVGAGLEQLKEEDVDSLITDYFFFVSKPLWKNMTIFVNMIWTPIEKVTFALEFNNISTTYKFKNEEGKIADKDAKNNCVNLAFKFDF